MAERLFGYAGRIIAGDVVQAHQCEGVQVGLNLPAGCEQMVTLQESAVESMGSNLVWQESARHQPSTSSTFISTPGATSWSPGPT